MKHVAMILCMALAVMSSLSSCAGLQSAIDKVISPEDKASLSGLARDIVRFGEATGAIDPKALAAIKVADKLVLSPDGNANGLLAVASEQLIAEALKKKKITPEQAEALRSQGTVPLTPADPLAGSPVPIHPATP